MIYVLYMHQEVPSRLSPTSATLRRYFATATNPAQHKPLSTPNPNPAHWLMRIFRALREGAEAVLSRTDRWEDRATALLQSKADLHQLQDSLAASAVGVVNSATVEKVLARIERLREWEHQALQMGSEEGMSEDEFVQFCVQGRAMGVSVQVMRPVLARLQDAQRWIDDVGEYDSLMILI